MCHVLSPVVVTNVASPAVSVHLTLPLTAGDGVWHRNEAEEAAAHGVTLCQEILSREDDIMLLH